MRISRACAEPMTSPGSGVSDGLGVAIPGRGQCRGGGAGFADRHHRARRTAVADDRLRGEGCRPTGRTTAPCRARCSSPIRIWITSPASSGCSWRSYFDEARRGNVQLYVPASVVPLLHQRVGDYPNALAEGGANFWDAFQVIPVGGAFWHDGVRLEVFPARHHWPETAYGLRLRGSLVWTGDTRPIPEMLAKFADAGEQRRARLRAARQSLAQRHRRSGARISAPLLRRCLLYHYASAQRSKGAPRAAIASPPGRSAGAGRTGVAEVANVHECGPAAATRRCRSDALKRPLRDLRLSVIEACNFRCPYCMPPDRIADDYGLDSASRLSLRRNRACWCADSSRSASTSCA